MIKINANKARAIAHGLRRAARAVEFAPLDDEIARRLPGADLAALEAARQAVRDRYAVIQTEIDAASVADLAQIVRACAVNTSASVSAAPAPGVISAADEGRP